ncbi:methyltransferase domain-containing protein [Xanthomonas hyacinthi]|uniref:Kinase n=1 Tax=Xanthomonas hyacinthi TaxID=56455 RepID=A0A2S7F3H3_9XANT|nr:methyltransferase domain-containing protein [Xanthomonas hyacinthi]KLD73498.1 kinase [Xanthomonas hyacinthi DSM 19077]PPU99986.1 kinase [Xanthomonas hyacinthi]QGY76165.1 methyltransferase domain-containing protein [Xanthomonas hyacinthi]
MNESQNIAGLVAALPEKYQPIYAHPELSEGSSRGCEDRLLLIRECARRLQSVLGRSIRVLDLGCAQGFFSLSLAADGHGVRGVDFLDRNVAVCQGLAREHPEFDAVFEHATIEEVVERLGAGEYDLVLGLSVFHHLVHAQGVARVNELCRKLADVTCAAIFEMALREEPLYWAASLPQDPAELLASFGFVRLLSRQATHLSTVSRPLYYASNRFWYVGDALGEFETWSADSHAYARGTHKASRRYYFGKDVFVKKMTLGLGGRAEINLQEFNNEVGFLQNPPHSYPAPRLINALNDSSDLWLVREKTEGRLLSELIDDGSPYSADRVISELLEQLVILERAGLYHNDVRCWNVLVSEDGRAVLIDYGAISDAPEDCSWLGDLLLSFLITVKEIVDRRIVPSTPGREPALDFMTLPDRYRNACIRLFGQNQRGWTFAELQVCLSESSPASMAAPEWAGIYTRLQRALLSYNSRLGLLQTQSEHDRIELVTRAASLDEIRRKAQESQEQVSALQFELEMANTRYRDLEERSRRLVEWSRELESRVYETQESNAGLSARIEELGSQEKVAAMQLELEMANTRHRDLEESGRRLAELSRALEFRAYKSQESNVSLSARIVELEMDLEEHQRARELAELLAADVERLTAERDALQVAASGGRLLKDQHEASIRDLQAKIASHLQRAERSETSRSHDRRRLEELHVNLSQRVHTVESARNRIRELEFAVEALERQVASIHDSRSWRVTAPLRWFSTAVLGRPRAALVRSRPIGARGDAAVADAGLPTPADAALEKRLAALDQLGSRIRKSR